MDMKSKIYLAIGYIIMLLILWAAISSRVQAFMCPKMTETELLINIPNSFVFNFKNCE